MRWTRSLCQVVLPDQGQAFCDAVLTLRGALAWQAIDLGVGTGEPTRDERPHWADPWSGFHPGHGFFVFRGARRTGSGPERRPRLTAKRAIGFAHTFKKRRWGSWKSKSRSLVVRPHEDMRSNFLGMTTQLVAGFDADAALKTKGGAHGGALSYKGTQRREPARCRLYKNNPGYRATNKRRQGR
jgi:hypothetical protein